MGIFRLKRKLYFDRYDRGNKPALEDLDGEEGIYKSAILGLGLPGLIGRSAGIKAAIKADEKGESDSRIKSKAHNRAMMTGGLIGAGLGAGTVEGLKYLTKEDIKAIGRDLETNVREEITPGIKQSLKHLGYVPTVIAGLGVGALGAIGAEKGAGTYIDDRLRYRRELREESDRDYYRRFN